MSNRGKRTTTAGGGDDEVEQLLRAAQDDVLLKLTLNSHLTSSSSSAIDPDLDRRFQALKKPTNKIDASLKKNTAKPDTISAVKDRVDTGDGDGDDLLARFAALKNSIPSHNKADVSINTRLSKEDQESEEEEEEEDEVEKVIKWGIDAARLDPSPPSEDEDDDDGSDEDDDDSDDGVDSGKKGKKK